MRPKLPLELHRRERTGFQDRRTNSDLLNVWTIAVWTIAIFPGETAARTSDSGIQATSSVNSVVDASEELTLTSEEKAWIADHPVVRLGVDPEFHPFEFIDDDGSYKGIAADYLAILGKRLGIQFDVIAGLSWDEAVERVRRRELDMLPAVGMTEERKTFLLYSRPYVQFSRVIIARTDMPFLSCLEDLGSLRVAVQAASSHVGFLKEYTSLKPMVYPTLKDTLLAVSDGEADVMVGNVASASYTIRRMNLTNLKVAGAAGRRDQGIHFAVRKDWPLLATLLQKGVDAIDPRDREAISKKWVVLKFDPQVRYGPLLLIVFGAAVGFALILLWNRQLKRHRNQSQAAKEAAEAARRETEQVNRELRDLSMRLEEEVAARTRELQKTQEQFYQAQKLEALGTLVGGIAHDFNNVLSGVLGMIELVKDDLTGEAAERLAWASEVGFRGADLIAQLLAFARQEQAGKAPLRVSRLVKGLRALSGPAVMKNVILSFDVQCKQYWLNGNLALLQQALLNLLTNARDAVRGVEAPRVSVKGYTLCPTAETISKHPELSERTYFAFEVRDNGKGIAAEQMPKLFDPFYTTKAPGQGTGLGLPMVYGAVRDHQGAVWAESAPGQGAVFFLLLPLLDNLEQVEDERVSELVQGTGETVLLVEDEAVVREVHRMRLIRLGYNVITACDADDAMRQYTDNSETIDLLLLDVILPGKDGVSVAESARLRVPSIPVLFLTGYETGAAVRWVKEHHRVRLLKKPTSPAVLSRTLHSLLHGDGIDT